jgi:MFS family permease
VLTASFGLLALGRTSVVPLLFGVLIADVGAQGIQITNQAIIFTLDPERRSRINSAYMVCYFSGGALGSLAAGFTYTHHGWTGMCLLGMAIGLVTLVMTLVWRPTPSAN